MWCWFWRQGCKVHEHLVLKRRKDLFISSIFSALFLYVLIFHVSDAAKKSRRYFQSANEDSPVEFYLVVRNITIFLLSTAVFSSYSSENYGNWFWFFIRMQAWLLGAWAVYLCFIRLFISKLFQWISKYINEEITTAKWAFLESKIKNCITLAF